MTITIAIIGLGIMGQRMLAEMEAHEAFAPDLIWDPAPDHAALEEALARGARLVDRATEAIAGADLVYLACPPGPRRDYAVQAAASGKALFLEKPLGVDVAASADLVAFVQKAGVPAAVNFTQATGPALRAIAADAQAGRMGDLAGIDIVVTYAAWPRAWQRAADWLRLRDEGGMTREVISHFVFFAERILGPLRLIWARPSYPDDPALCETHLLARLENDQGLPVSVLASVGGAQPDRQELTIKGRLQSRKVESFYVDLASDGGPFQKVAAKPDDPRHNALQGQLDDLARMMAGEPHQLATLDEALRVQRLIEAMLRGQG